MDWEVPDSLSREIAGGHVMSSVVVVVLCGVINHISRQKRKKKDYYHDEYEHVRL